MSLRVSREPNLNWEHTRFSYLDGLRGIAATAVAVEHGQQYFGSVVGSWYLSVDFFFVLSGFVLGHAYWDKLRSGMTFVEFLSLRLIRLYPMYLLGSSFLFVFCIFVMDYPIERLAAAALLAVLFLPAPQEYSVLNGELFSLDHPAWSLFFELVVNMMFVPVAKSISPHLCKWIGALAAVILARYIFYHGSADFGWTHGDFPIAGIIRVTYPFVAGLSAYAIYQQKNSRHKHQRGWHFSLLCGFALIMILALRPHGRMREVYDAVCIIFFFPGLVYLSAFIEVRGVFDRMCRILGELSYPIYVLHAPAYAWLAWCSGYQADAARPIGFAVMIIFGLFALSYFLMTWIDIPLRVWLRIRLRKFY